MSEILDISGFPVLPVADRLTPMAGVPGSISPTPAALDAKDTVEFSERAAALARAVAESSFRLARAVAIREAIHNDAYETPERIDVTVERLLDVFG